jgi:transcription elongation factor GreA
LGLRRKAAKATLGRSQKADDRGVGLPEVAVFLLDVIVPVRVKPDRRPAGETSQYHFQQARTILAEQTRPLNRPPHFENSNLKAVLNRRVSFPSVALDRDVMSCVTPGPEAPEVECQNWEQTRMSTDRIPMSKEGYEKLKAQLDKMKNEDMLRIAEQIAQARGYGDLSENAEFDAAVEAQGMLQARINDLQNKLGQAYIVDKSNIPSDRVVFGSKVRVLDIEIDEAEDFILVGPGEEDYDQNKILLTSPIGQSLVGKKVGDQVEVQIPRGVLKLKIVEIGMA